MLRFTRGTVGGSALSTDASDPNTAEPTVANICRVPKSASKAVIHAFGGTTTTVTLWAWDPTAGKWLALYASVAVTPTTPQFKDIPMDCSKLFVQITANTGVPFLGVSFA